MEEKKMSRYNHNKPQWSLLDYNSLIPLVRAMEYGANKYSRDDWKGRNDNPNQILESLARHLFALMSGEEIDSESGVLHIGCIMANAMIWQYHNEKNKNSTYTVTELKDYENISYEETRKEAN